MHAVESGGPVPLIAWPLGRQLKAKLVNMFNFRRPSGSPKIVSLDWRQFRGCDLRPHGVTPLDIWYNDLDIWTRCFDPEDVAEPVSARVWPRSYEKVGTSAQAYNAVLALSQLQLRPAPAIPMPSSRLEHWSGERLPSLVAPPKCPVKFAEPPMKEEVVASRAIYDRRRYISLEEYRCNRRTFGEQPEDDVASAVVVPETTDGAGGMAPVSAVHARYLPS